MAARKLCETCQTRPALTAAKSLRIFGTEFPYCYPCHELANWENTHSDYGHDLHDDGTLVGEYTEDCWICHPELDQTRADYTARTGTSRAGMTINVPIRAGAKDKAKVAATKIGATDARIQTSTKTGVTTLKSKSFDMVLVWDQRGRFLTGNVAGRAIRNVAEAIRATR
jgi:hypothetical protein